MTNTEKQTEALRLADCLERDIRLEWMEIDHNTAAAAELRRLDAEDKRLNVALDEWMEKTDWVQQTIRPRELGMHRADVLRARIEALDAENKSLLAALEAVEMDVVEVGMGESVISDSARYKVEDVLLQIRGAQAAAKDGGAA